MAEPALDLCALAVQAWADVRQHSWTCAKLVAAVQASRAYEVAAHFRRLGVPVVMGGIHATMCLDEVMERVDSVVTGEAEGVWPQVLEDARHGRLKRRYDGGRAQISDVPFARHDLLATGRH